MNMISKKGSILVLVLFFAVLSMIASAGLYFFAYHLSREVIVSESSMRKYYAAVAGSRYGYILLKDPVGNLDPGAASHDPNITGGGLSTVAHDGETVTLTITPTSAFGRNIGLRNGETLTVLIKEWDTGVTEWDDGNYNVRSTF